MRSGWVALGLVWLVACQESDTVQAPAEDLATASPVADVTAADVASADVAAADVEAAIAAEPDLGADLAPDVPWSPGRAACDPCTASTQCGGSEAGVACVAMGLPAGSAGHFCAVPCGETAPCAAGSSCVLAATIEGDTAPVCIPNQWTCGCSPAAAQAGWTTPCFAASFGADGLLEGKCAGTWSCAAGGCNAPKPSAEVCNGSDDDCDGQTDEEVACDDGDPCTQGDACVAGKCLIGKDVCGCHADADCQGGDKCLGQSVCDKTQMPWTCQIVPGSQVTCKAGETACSLPTCDPKTGACKAQPKPDGTPCDADGSPCTVIDACQGGACKPGATLPCDDGNPCTFDGCDAKQGCGHQPQVGPCDDGNACTSGDVCKGGTCKPGSAKACSDGNPCTAEGCDPATGTCQPSGFATNGTVCDDGQACTVADACLGGTCQGQAKACSDGNPCTTDTCTQGTCGHQAASGACDDGNPCTSGDACQGGQCTGGAGACACASDADCSAKGNPCLGKFVCDKSKAVPQCVAVPGTAPSCQGSAGPCVASTCDPASGQCAPKSAPDGKLCDDGDGCTAGDACQGGKCLGQAVPCDDGNPCTADACKSGSCQHLATSGACDDGNPCTSGEACSAGLCSGGQAKDCGDGNPCTVDSCSVKTGACQHDGGPLVGKSCSSPCGAAVCQAGGCVPTGGAPCDDGNPCTKDSCGPTGCAWTPGPGNCKDLDECTGNEACTNGKCVGQPIGCDDGNACTADACDPAKGCVHTAKGGPCSDGDPCTLTDACQGGVCLPGAVSPCDDGNPCTLDTCKLGTCSSAPAPMEGKACPPAKNCNGNATCQAGACIDPAGTCPSKKGREIWPPVFPDKLGPAKTLFDPVGVHTVTLTVEPKVWNQYLASVAAKSTDVYFPATISIDGVAYPQVGIRPFGYGSLFSNPNKPNVRITFDHYDENAKGPEKLKNLRLKASGQDRTYLRQPIAQTMTQQAGGYAPRWSWARVAVNGEPYGLYQVLEYADKRMYSANFSNNDGNEYDRKQACIGLNCPSGGCAAIKNIYKGDPGDGAEIVKLVQAIHDMNDAQWLTTVAGIANLDSMLALYATEAITSDIDGLAAAGQNFVMYVNEDTGKLEFIQTGPDLSLGNKTPWYDLLKPWGNPPNVWCSNRKDDFFLRLLATSEAKAQLLARYKTLRCGVFDPATLLPIIQGYRKLLGPDLYNDPKGIVTPAQLDKAFETLEAFVTQRGAQLGALVGPCP